MEHKDIINQEIQRLSIQIASVRYDWEQAVKQKLAYALVSVIAQELVELEHQRKCLRLGNFKDLPYNIKLLYNAQR